MNDTSTFTNYTRILLTMVAILAAAMSACGGGGATATTSEEESGTELALDERYDAVRNGARLVLNYDAPCNSFNGFVENTAENTLKRVRVEVHLSNGVELGPTTPRDLNPGESINVSLEASAKGFDRWTAHPEVGESGGDKHGQGEGEREHGEGGEGGYGKGGSD